MKKVGIAATGLTKFSKGNISLESLMLSSTKNLFENTRNLEQKDIDVVLVSTNDNQKYVSSILSELSGISPKISHSIESLCNSGVNATISAYSYIASGLADVALVVGVEKFDSPGLIFEWDVSRGEYKHPIYWASLFTKAHKRKYGTTREDLAYVSALNHKNALENQYAFFEKAYSVDEIMNSKHLTDDVHLLDCSFPCNGSAALLLASENELEKFTDTPVWISGVGQKTIAASFTKNHDLSSMISTKESSMQAYQMSKKIPKDIDVAEVHDAFTICELIELEDLGFVEKGKGSQYVRNAYDTSDRRINPRGGLLGAGHPLGATGIAQVVEISQQLGGKAGKRQVDTANTGLVHNMSAAGTSSSILILET